MNKTQEQLLTKQFKVNERFTIAREDYENMPDPMLAFTWSDERMEELARRIGQNLCPYDENDPEGMEDDFWKEMEAYPDGEWGTSHYIVTLRTLEVKDNIGGSINVSPNV